MTSKISQEARDLLKRNSAAYEAGESSVPSGAALAAIQEALDRACGSSVIDKTACVSDLAGIETQVPPVSDHIGDVTDMFAKNAKNVPPGYVLVPEIAVLDALKAMRLMRESERTLGVQMACVAFDEALSDRAMIAAAKEG